MDNLISTWETHRTNLQQQLATLRAKRGEKVKSNGFSFHVCIANIFSSYLDRIWTFARRNMPDAWKNGVISRRINWKAEFPRNFGKFNRIIFWHFCLFFSHFSFVLKKNEQDKTEKNVSRNFYTKRILEIVANVRKQKEEIERVNNLFSEFIPTLTRLIFDFRF